MLWKAFLTVDSFARRVQDHIWAEFGRHRSNLGRIGPVLFKHGMVSAELA